MMYYLSVDFGTSAVKMSVLDEELRVKCWNKAEYQYLILPGEKNELRETDLMNAFYSAAAGLDPELLKKVEMFCYDTFSPSVVFMDREGELVYRNIITHLDRRSRKQSDDIERLIGKDAYMSISGIYPFAGGCSAMTLLWFVQNMPEIIEKSSYIGHLTTWIHKKLTGLWMVDFVNASMLGVYETTKQGGWSKEILKEIGVDYRLFPEIRYPGSVYGRLKKEIAHRLGLREGIPVCVGTNDVAAAQMGAGNCAPGDIMDTAGSSEMVSILTDQPVTNPGYYLRNSALPGIWQVYATTCGGFGIRWFYEQFCRELSIEEFYRYEEREINRFLAQGNGGITADPYLSGDRQSLEKRTASFRGLTLAYTRGELLTAMLEGIQSVIYGTISMAEQFQRIQPVIKISGGMVTPAYLKLKEAMYPQYKLLQVDDCPILGNAALAQYWSEKSEKGETKGESSKNIKRNSHSFRNPV